MPKKFLMLMGSAVVAFVVSVIMHNAISAIWNVEEPVFFIIAVVIAPIAFAVGLIGSAVVLFRRLTGKGS